MLIIKLKCQTQRPQIATKQTYLFTTKHTNYPQKERIKNVFIHNAQ